jgi:elongator complex protein 3
MKLLDPKADAHWLARHQPVAVDGRERLFAELIEALVAQPNLKGGVYRRVMSRYVRQGLPWLSKDQLLQVYQALCDDGWLEFRPEVVTALQMKPTRSQAGVTVVTVLTKPYPCPGKCIFCPTDVRMPKSYLHDEPGARRAERHAFDPYDQTLSRIQALENIGHPADKIELLILGGTWSSYRRDYQEWFVKRCLDAMNGYEAETLAEAQTFNTTGPRRNVGLVVETRQDHIDVDELRWLRYLGVTKVQVGIQSLNDEILRLNARGHDVEATRQAFRLLRLAGFKIHGHWMANLLGATPETDLADFAQLWADPAIRPDELKIYPCMLVENAELYSYWQQGEYQPYDEETLTELLVACKPLVPGYTRLTRIIRDIPTTNVVAGNKKANLRQIVQERMKARGRQCGCIRCREVRRQPLDGEMLNLRIDSYETDGTLEHFLGYETADGRLAGFLRLSFPDQNQPHPLPELAGKAMIREVHVYGPALPIGEESQGAAQHIGLGARLVAKAKEMAREAGYGHLAVISAIGTRDYYARHGFAPEGLYMTVMMSEAPHSSLITHHSHFYD